MVVITSYKRRTKLIHAAAKGELKVPSFYQVKGHKRVIPEISNAMNKNILKISYQGSNHNE